MRFVDECEVRVIAGGGGNGCVAFRREKFVPFGGPSGGDGGHGGSVIFVADEGLGTLLDIQNQRVIQAARGGHGEGSDCYGRCGKDVEVRVPVGTVVFDADTGEKLVELVGKNDRAVVAQGGKGGLGNIHFATSTNRAPRRANPGEPGEERTLRLELKMMADVGLLGFPNVGKSTLISAVSRARPKVADYPFTTLTPQLGVVGIGDTRRGLGRTFVLADVPGLIEGAAEGAGLGTRFLRHLERTRVLLHLITLDEGEGREPFHDYEVICRELRKHNPELARRPQVVALSQSDRTDVREAYPELKAKFATAGVQLRLVSAVTHENLDDLMQEVWEKLYL